MNAAAVRVFIVDDHPVSRLGLAVMLREDPRFEWVGEAEDGAVAAPRIALLRPDVVLTDVAMPRTDGFTLVRSLARDLGGTRFVMLGDVGDPAQVRRAFEAGARAFLDKSVTVPALVETIRQVCAGYRVLEPDRVETGQGRRPSPIDALTWRERQVLVQMAQGRRNEAIAQRLHVSTPTVKYHVTRILRKLGVDSRTAAVLVAVEQGLVEGLESPTWPRLPAGWRPGTAGDTST